MKSKLFSVLAASMFLFGASFVFAGPVDELDCSEGCSASCGAYFCTACSEATGTCVTWKRKIPTIEQ